jgi:hypothetical protein
MEHDGSYIPRFPHARVLLGRADWDWSETQHALLDPHSLESRTFGVLQKHNLLELVEGHPRPDPEVHIIAAPGESPGHQIVRVLRKDKPSIAWVTSFMMSMKSSSHHGWPHGPMPLPT